MSGRLIRISGPTVVVDGWPDVALHDLATVGEEQLLAYRFNGIRYDCGSKLGYLQAQVAFGLKHEELRKDFAAYLKTVS